MRRVRDARARATLPNRNRTGRPVAAVQSKRSKIWARMVALKTGPLDGPSALMAINVDRSLAPENLIVRVEIFKDELEAVQWLGRPQ